MQPGGTRRAFSEVDRAQRHKDGQRALDLALSCSAGTADGFVYFIGDGRDLVKIGKASDVQSLGCAERLLHARWRHLRVGDGAEWFRYEVEIRGYVTQFRHAAECEWCRRLGPQPGQGELF